MNFKPIFFSLLLSSSLLFVACSSSNSTTPPTPPPVANTAPTVTISSSATVDEKTSAVLSANASDSDGSISMYAWTQTAGTSVSLSSSNAANVSFTAPIAKSVETLSFEVVVTDDDGAIASDTLEITVNPVNELSFTIKGEVTNGSPTPATVEARYAGNTLAVSAPDGTYELDISEDEDLANELLFLNAVQPDNVGFNLANIPISLAELTELAGADAELTITDDIAADITPLSTAYYSLLSQEINLTTATAAEKEQALALLPASDLLNTAASINILSQSPLPAGITAPMDFVDTLTFSADRTAVALFVKQVFTTSPNLIETATATTFSQSRPLAFTPSYPQTLYGIAENQSFAGNYQFALNADGTGEQIGVSTDRTNSVIAWSVDAEGVYTITGENGNDIIQDEPTTRFMDVNGVFQAVAVIQIIREINLTPAFQEGSNLVFDVTVTSVDTFPETPELDSVETTNTFYKSFFTQDNLMIMSINDLFSDDSLEAKHLIGFEIDGLVDRIIGVRQDMGEITETNRGDFVNLSRNNASDTSGNFTFQKLADETEQGIWTLADNTLNLNFFSTYTGSQVPVSIELSMLNPNFAISTTDTNGVKLANYGVFTIEDTSEKPANSADFVGVYYYPLRLDGTANPFWFQFYDNGEYEQVSMSDNDNDGMFEDDEVSISIGSWSLDAGKVSFNRYWDFTTGDRTCFRDSSNMNCNLFSERLFDVANIDSDNIFVKSDFNIFFPSDFNNPVATNELSLTFNDARILKIATNPPIDINTLPAQNN